MANNVRIGVGVDDKATRPIRDIHDAFKRLQNDGAKGLGIGLGAAAGLQAWNLAGTAIHEVTGFLMDSVKAAIDEEAGLKRLDAALKANVPSWDGNSAAIEGVISAREALAFSDDSLRSSLAILVGATHDVNKAFEIQSTAMDLARYKGISLEEASTALIKVEGGHYRALQGLGIQLKAGATATEALAAVQKVAGGQAVAFGNTTAGAMESASIAVHDLQEEIGQQLAPTVKDVARMIRTDLIPALHGVNLNIDQSLPTWALLDNVMQKVHDDANADSKAVGEGLAAALAKGNDHVVAISGSVGDLEAALNSLVDAGLAQAQSAFIHTQDSAGGARTAIQLVGQDAYTASGGFDQLAASANASAVEMSIAFAQANRLGRAAERGAGTGGGPQGTKDDPGDLNDGRRGLHPFVPPRVHHKPPPTGGGGGGSSGPSQAEKDAKAAADALRNDLKDAYAVAKQAADQTFAKIHQGTLDAIKGAKDHAYAVAQTTYNLKMEGLEAQKVALYEKRNADQTALSAEQAARSMRDLKESVADAEVALNEARQGSQDADGNWIVDPKAVASAERALRNANEALADAQAQAVIAAETSAADAAAAKIDAAEQAAKDELAVAQKAADDLAAVQTTAENERYEAEKAAYDRAYTLLVGHLDDTKNLHSKVNKDILAAYEAENKKYEAAGKAIAASLLKGLKGELKVTIPGVEIKGQAEDWQALKDGGASGASSGTSASASGSASDPAYQRTRTLEGSGSRSTTINVYNPAPEPASTSVTQNLRTLAAFGVV